MITITIQAETFEEALKDAYTLTNFASSAAPASPTAPQATYTPVAVASPTNTGAPTPATPVTTTSAPAAVVNTAPQVAQSAPATPAPAQTPTAPVQPPIAPPAAFTHEQVGKAGADLVAANPGTMPTLMELLQRYGVQLVTDLKLEQLGPFATELRGLGAKI